MTKRHSIGVFDSGVGGLTVVQTLLRPAKWPGWFVVILTVTLLAAVGGLMSRARTTTALQQGELKKAQSKVEQLNRLRLEREVSAGSESSTMPAANVPVTPRLGVVPPVPDALIKAIVAGQCILYSGIGLSAQANLPTTYEILRGLLDESAQDREELMPALTSSRFSELAELLLRRRGRDAIVASIAQMYEGESTRTTSVHTALAALPFVGAVNTAWDSLVERSFATARGSSVIALNAGQSESTSTMPTSEEFVVAKPFGTIARPETFQFTIDEASRAIQRNKAFYRTIAAMLGSRSVFYVGTSLRSIQDLLSGAQLTLSDKPHFALVPVQDATPLQRELFQSKYGIELIPFEPSAGFPEVGRFVRALSAAVNQALVATAPPTFQKANLASVTLTNIGAFKNLTVTFNGQWNVILGNNGSGKSTLLRAIALGICGDDANASSSAKRLLRAGTMDGTIDLRFGDTSYKARLYKDGDTVRVESQFTPLQQGRWVVLGFPPLRGVSTGDPTGVGPSGPAKPVVDDLLPLIRGSIDVRLNNLKQWLVNIDSGTRSSDPRERALNVRLQSSFWTLLKKLTPGVRIEPGVIRSSTWEVMVNTEDGEVSIDQVSQGMSSVFGWVGAALQRMYEIHGQSEHPELEPALILVDELDAHLHPEWQQRLIALLRECFPNLQIIATSHSPLVVAGMKSHEVFVASRDDEDRTVVNILPVQPDVQFELLRFDQILMSPLFGLTSTRSEVSKKEYVKLAAKPAEKRTEEEQKRYDSLRAMLLDSAQPQSTAHGRQLAEGVREAVMTAVRENSDPEELQRKGKLTPEVAEELRARMAALAPTPSRDSTHMADSTRSKAL